MKVKYIGAVLCAAALTFFGCDDTTDALGTGMLPDSDGISAHSTTFDVVTRSVLADSVFAKSSIGYVGRFTDAKFGSYEASFLTELNCRENFKFPEVYDFEKKTGRLTENKITGVRLRVFYSTWFGDSLNACQISAFQLNNKLEYNRYTNINPADYYSSTDLLGKCTYTAYDTSVTDEERYATDDSGSATYYPHIDFTLNTEEYGSTWYELAQNNPNAFKDSESFINNVFKGVYLKSDYGDGTVLYVDRVDLQMQYEFYVLNDTTNIPYKRKDKDHLGEDSIGKLWSTEFASTKEVIQANQFQNSEKIKSLVEENDWTYIKSPAGIFTEVELPYNKINEQLAGDSLNAVKLTFTNYNEKSDNAFSMSAPKYVLLLRKLDFKNFFEENKLPDNITSFTVEHNSVATNQYTFSNIARLVSTNIANKEADKKKAKEEADADPNVKWNEAQWEKDWSIVYLIPISIVFDTSSSYQKTITSIHNDLQPGYAKLKGGPAEEGGKVRTPLKLEVIHTKFNK